jgi:hypothetical protein
MEMKIFSTIVMFNNFDAAKEGEADLRDAGYSTRVIDDRIDPCGPTVWGGVCPHPDAEQLENDPLFDRECDQICAIARGLDADADEFGLDTPESWPTRTNPFSHDNHKRD